VDASGGGREGRRCGGGVRDGRGGDLGGWGLRCFVLPLLGRRSGSEW
jgi:hypothetical protein